MPRPNKKNLSTDLASALKMISKLDLGPVVHTDSNQNQMIQSKPTDPIKFARELAEQLEHQKVTPDETDIFPMLPYRVETHGTKVIVVGSSRNLLHELMHAFSVGWGSPFNIILFVEVLSDEKDPLWDQMDGLTRITIDLA